MAYKEKKKKKKKKKSRRHNKELKYTDPICFLPSPF